MSRFIIVIYFIIGLFGCSSQRMQLPSQNSQYPPEPKSVVRIIHDTIFLSELKKDKEPNDSLFDKSASGYGEVADKCHFGIYVKKLHTDKIILDYQANKLFVPASNIKILTLLQSINQNQDSIIFGDISIKDSVLHLRPKGDPTFLNKKLEDSSLVLQYLQNSQATKVKVYMPLFNERYGKGWTWDDYNQTYQAEISPLPIFGNLCTFRKINGSVIATPSALKDSIKYISNEDKNPGIKRMWNENVFKFDLSEKYFAQQSLPMIVDDEIIQAILTDTLRKSVELVRGQFFPSEFFQLKSHKMDSLYKIMMQESDNFVAEQILFQIIAENSEQISFQNYFKKQSEIWLPSFPDVSKIVDGSGLSRYNLQSPRNIVFALEKIHELKGMEWIQVIFPSGGESGSIKKRYKSPNGYPWMFAKTGTLSGIHALSGYLRCNSGEILVFSLMYNNFSVPLSNIQNQIEKILLDLYWKN